MKRMKYFGLVEVCILLSGFVYIHVLTGCSLMPSFVLLQKFYLRCLKSGCTSYQCAKQQDCTITRETRSHCQYCRYQKCISLGMYKPGMYIKLYMYFFIAAQIAQVAWPIHSFCWSTWAIWATIKKYHQSMLSQT